LEELETHWSLDDAERAIAILDMDDFVKEEQQKEMERNNKG